ncbi:MULTISPECIES: lysylphosphatidylglycerol synthase domain-containing protein [unclassified Solwaraspora]|uniref:lysylphosphatidylglycerol synthase transmembrane domain-containing protein n=1 Tax=unclassified Solwaraspora TaxID=2627926 RepID=UPI00248B4AD0|nr:MULTISPECIES: lysylphosphatidylglycerol synthase domain-containing protein [unclassified Solwaraspora]WBB96737.1 lysylphosphatidylglycerol synthase domain-containing protein [Solwaraspora sp. WMMA2059]WBC19359.1 lysylphosphatidylglycerol synthase domain-containing protein [Solwaraspora sp. WMMA2080]WJK33198.1 lysylphosphatidylglycerol synthase domain-containing protein [Solwaraspora sp. WMMA2065]
MHPPASHRPSLLRRALQVAVVGAFAGFIGWALASQWSQVRATATDLTVPSLLLATAGAIVALWCNFLSWRAILADFGSRIPLGAGMRVFFVGQLGKYLPGKLWPMLTQARLGRTYQVPGRSSAAAALLVMAVSLGTGLLLTVCLLPLVSPAAFDRYWWALLALPLAAAGLWPPLLNRGLAIAMRLARREPMPRPLSLSGIGQSVLWSVLAWLAYGGHIWALLRGLGAADGPHLVFLSIAAFAGSWAIGFLLIVAPAGAGPREAALVVILSVSVSQPIALVAAVVSRLLMIVVDVAAPAVAVLLANRFPGGEPRQPGLADRTDEVDSAHHSRSEPG